MNGRTAAWLWAATLVVVAALAVPSLFPRVEPAAISVDPHPQDGLRSAAAAQPEQGSLLEPIAPLPLTLDLDRRKVGLGRRLFHEKALSGDGSVSCASCHSLDLGGTDQKRVSTGVEGAQGVLNSPTVFNAGYNFKQFWDGRADTLEEQVEGPLHDEREMRSSWEQIEPRLAADERYVAQFASIYDDGLTFDNMKDAIAEFERSLVTPNSRFDRFLRGDRAALTTEEIEGYAIFKDVGCTTCHQGVNAGSTMFQRLGHLRPYFEKDGAYAKEHLGRFNVTGRERDRFKFKVPTLRNVELTFPYFHDGSVKSLEDAVRLMGVYQIGETLDDYEVGRIAAFLRTLTGQYVPYPEDE